MAMVRGTVLLEIFLKMTKKAVRWCIYKSEPSVPYPGYLVEEFTSERKARNEFDRVEYDPEVFRIVKMTLEVVEK